MRTLILTLSIALRLSAQTAAPPQAVDWRGDLQVLARELPAHQPAPFLRITQTQWDSAVHALNSRLPSLTRNQAFVGFFQLVALVGDAHTTIEPDPSYGFHQYPFELYDFDDGLFIRRADSAHARLVGARIVRFGALTSAEALARAGTIVSHENDWWVRAWAPFWLGIPEIANGLGLAPDDGRLRIVFDLNGRRDSTVVSPAGVFAHTLGGPPNWVTMRRAPEPYWEQRPESLIWWTVDTVDHLLYVGMRGILPAPRSATNRVQWDSVFALYDSLAPARLVIDLRENTGGNGTLNRYPVQQILRRPALNRPDRLFVVIGRRTFSAGQQFTNLLEAWTNATLVGEPTGQRTSQYGDHRPLVLPSSHVIVQISSVFHQAPNEFDTRTFVPPAIYAPLASSDYARGADPAFQAILRAGSGPAPVQAVAALILGGDTAAAERSARAAQGVVANRFRSLEGDLNGLGYRWLGSDSLPQALTVFALITRVYPQSANAFDSFGEALLAANRRDDAIASYRHALAIDPQFPPSVAALRRLGVSVP